MNYLFRMLLLLCVIMTSAGNLRAEKKQVPKKDDVPVGYEDAVDPKKEKTQEKEKVKKDADIPVGYKDAAKANNNKKRKRRRVVVPAVPPAEQNAEELADEDKLFAENAQLKAIEVQMREQLSPYFAAELTFARKVCEPNAKQLARMKAMATPELKKTIRKLAKQQGARQGAVVFAAGPMQQKQFNILDLFESAASRIVEEAFPEDIVEAYREQQQHRKDFHARAGAMALVVHLDGMLRLSQEQREILTDSIQQVWKRSWEPYLQFMASNPQFFPQVPDDAIVPHLSKVQVNQWNSMQRQNVHLGWQNLRMRGLFQNMQPEEIWFVEANEEPEKAQEVKGFLEGAFKVVIEAVADDEEGEDEEQEE